MYNKDVSKVENMNAMFSQTSSFNNDISKWDTSSVTTIDFMFVASSFNNDISKWSTSNVQRMESVFYQNHNFNQDISSWGKFTSPFHCLLFDLSTHSILSPSHSLCYIDVSNVYHMPATFFDARSFNQDLSKWNTSSVETMAFLFGYATSFNSNLSSWDVSNVKDMHQLFHEATSFNQDLSTWNPHAATEMGLLFKGASSFNQDLCAWGDILLQNLTVYLMFNSSGCNDTNSPNLSSTPPGPFCHPCAE
jgi:surface protein